MDHSPGKNPGKKDYECEAKYMPAKFMAGLYQSLTGDDKRHQMYDCYKNAKTDMSVLINLTDSVQPGHWYDDDISFELSSLWILSLASIHHDSMVKCPGVDNHNFEEQYKRA